MSKIFDDLRIEKVYIKKSQKAIFLGIKEKKMKNWLEKMP